MKRSTGIKGLIIFAAVVGLAGYAFAHGSGMMGGGMGRGMMGDGHGSGYGTMDQGRDYGRHRGGYGNGDLSREDAARYQQARNKFDEATRRLRNDIQDKQFELKDEMNQTEPDAAKVSRLQEELSRLQSEYDQKALAFELEIRKILPNGARGQNSMPDTGNDYRGW